MPETLILPQWDIPANEAQDSDPEVTTQDNNHWTGHLYANRAYDIQLVNDEHVMITISDVTTIDGDLTIIPKIVFTTNNGFRLPASDGSDNILVNAVQNVSEKYVIWKSSKNKRRSVSEDPFRFTFVNAKTGKPYTTRIDSDFFVCVVSRRDANSKADTYFGNLLEMSEDGQKVKMLALAARFGIYYTREVSIKVENIRGIFNYSLMLVDHKIERKPKPVTTETTSDEDAASMTSNHTTDDQPVETYQNDAVSDNHCQTCSGGHSGGSEEYSDTTPWNPNNAVTDAINTTSASEDDGTTDLSDPEDLQ